MTSKWIEEVENKADYYDRSITLSLLIPILERIDKILRKAMYSTDDENLSDEIRKELNG
jgi:hypothetical protein